MVESTVAIAGGIAAAGAKEIVKNSIFEGVVGTAITNIGYAESAFTLGAEIGSALFSATPIGWFAVGASAVYGIYKLSKANN